MKNRKLIALTFDDGLNETTTVQVLDLIEKHSITATFFVIGNKITAKTSEIMKRAVRLGCDFENHSLTHPVMSELTDEEISEETALVSERIREITGRAPKFFRPPYIAVNDRMHELINLVFVCGIGAEDYNDEVTAEQRYEKLAEQIQDGHIILLHDMEGNFRTVKALERLIPELLNEGYEFVTVNELFERNNVIPEKGKIYTNVHQ